MKPTLKYIEEGHLSRWIQVQNMNNHMSAKTINEAKIEAEDERKCLVLVQCEATDDLIIFKVRWKLD